MNKNKKGYLKEKLARDELVKEGWTILFKSVRSKFGTIDFAGLFDIVAMKNKKLKFISVKHLNNYNYYKVHQNNISNFKSLSGLENNDFELWLWDKKKHQWNKIKL